MSTSQPTASAPAKASPSTAARTGTTAAPAPPQAPRAAPVHVESVHIGSVHVGSVRAEPLWSRGCLSVWRHSADLAEVSFQHGSHLTAGLVLEAAHAAQAADPAPILHLLADVSGLHSVDPEAVRAFAETGLTGRLALVGRGPADEVIVRFALSAMPLAPEVRYFQDREAGLAFALGWGDA